VYLHSRVYLQARVLIQDSNREYLHTGACAVGLPFCLREFAISVIYVYKQSDDSGDIQSRKLFARESRQIRKGLCRHFICYRFFLCLFAFVNLSICAILCPRTIVTSFIKRWFSNILNPAYYFRPFSSRALAPLCVCVCVCVCRARARRMSRVYIDSCYPSVCLVVRFSPFLSHTQWSPILPSECEATDGVE
jgi:hypothetical protein